eukprot:488402-Rhodomonas_salina.1
MRSSIAYLGTEHRVAAYPSSVPDIAQQGSQDDSRITTSIASKSLPHRMAHILCHYRTSHSRYPISLPDTA